VRLRNGNTLISDQFNNQVIEVNHETIPDIVFTQGMIAVMGSGFDELNGAIRSQGGWRFHRFDTSAEAR
jgi:hypothetical protein